jgi:hypothetical protein
LIHETIGDFWIKISTTYEVFPAGKIRVYVTNAACLLGISFIVVMTTVWRVFKKQH